MIGDIFEKIKGEGVRILLLPFLGTLQMITYMTIKTANGLINQFFQAFSNAFFIEYADYLNKKDKKKFLTSYIVIYIVICFLITPSAFFLQLIINPLFDIWTTNKISFDPMLFALFTSSFLMMIFYTPSLLIIKGKNLFKKYMHITVLANIVYLILISILVNIYSLIGAGISLLILETILCLSFFYYANKWLKNNFIEFKYKIILFYGLDLVISIMFILLLGAEIFNVFYITLAFTIFKLLYGISFLKLAPDEIKSILYYFNKR
jgi:O-antigen/teichoic acid export membrane protein